MDVTTEGFTKDVVERSSTTPVLVDFWAPWCGPCLVLGPVLEKLEREAGGRWLLVKVNTDVETELARLFDIRGIPAVKLFKGGRVAAEFQGALPESTLRRWLEEQIPSESRMRLDAARAAARAGERATAKKMLERVVDDDPKSAEARVMLAEVLLPEEPDRARQLVDAARDDGALTERIAGVRLLAELLTRRTTGDGGPAAELFGEAVKLLQAGNYDGAGRKLIEVVKKDRAYGDDIARRALIALFHWLGDDSPTARQLRPQLATALF